MEASKASTKYYTAHLQDCVLPTVQVLKQIKRYGEYREIEGKDYAAGYISDEYEITLQEMLKEDGIHGHKGMIEDVSVFALLQKYDDGRPDKVWSVGDNTKDGKIIAFTKGETGYWYAVTDTPSEWQKERGQKTGWSWIFQLEAAG